MDASMEVFVSLVGRALDSPPVVAFFLTQPATARRRRGRTDLAGSRSLSSAGAGDEAGLWPWDRYDSEALGLHIAYGESGHGLRLLTLMSPDVAP